MIYVGNLFMPGANLDNKPPPPPENVIYQTKTLLVKQIYSYSDLIYDTKGILKFPHDINVGNVSQLMYTFVNTNRILTYFLVTT